MANVYEQSCFIFSLCFVITNNAFCACHSYYSRQQLLQEDCYVNSCFMLPYLFIIIITHCNLVGFDVYVNVRLF